MEITNPSVTKLNKSEGSKVLIYLLVFLFTIHITPATYINSSFLEQFLGSGQVGFVFSVASVLLLLVFSIIYKILNKVGNFKTFITFLTLDLISLIILSTSLIFSGEIWGWIFIATYIVGFISRSVAFLNIDIFMEHFSSDSDTGGIRGIFLTCLNFAFILGPLIAGLIVTDVVDAGKIYLLSSILLIPVFVISIYYFRKFKDSKYEHGDFLKTIKKVGRNKNLFNIFGTNFILRFFYSWMVIYTPIFLLKYIGFSLGEVALITGISLVPFVIFQIPLGKIADRVLGEKEILITGFIIMSIATGSIAFFDVHSFWFWVSILFVTRIGASAVEVMTETYLFKKIDDDDVNIISLYRSVRPMAYIISPIIASMVLVFFEINSLFFILSIVLLSGTYFAYRLKDTL